jgi:hypothetical protein
MTLSVTFFFASSADTVAVAVATVVTAVETALSVAERVSVVDIMGARIALVFSWVACYEMKKRVGDEKLWLTKREDLSRSC